MSDSNPYATSNAPAETGALRAGRATKLAIAGALLAWATLPVWVVCLCLMFGGENLARQLGISSWQHWRSVFGAIVATGVIYNISTVPISVVLLYYRSARMTAAVAIPSAINFYASAKFLASWLS